MKNVFLYLFILSCMLFDEAMSKETITFEIIGKSVRSDTINLPSGKKFVSFKHEGGFKSSIAKYGTYFCKGNIFYNEDNLLEDMTFICENIDQNGDKFWQIGKRNKGSEMDVAVGESVIFEAEGFWKDFIGIVCTYAVEYLSETIFASVKCIKS